MSSFSDEERAREWLLDIVEYSDRIADHLQGYSAADFAQEKMLYDAVERCVAIVTEAAIRLGPDRLRQVAPEVPFHAIKALGNQLRHTYRRIDPALIWKTVTEDVPALRSACIAALSKMKPE